MTVDIKAQANATLPLNTIQSGDCIEVMNSLPENSIDLISLIHPTTCNSTVICIVPITPASMQSMIIGTSFPHSPPMTSSLKTGSKRRADCSNPMGLFG